MLVCGRAGGAAVAERQYGRPAAEDRCSRWVAIEILPHRRTVSVYDSELHRRSYPAGSSYSSPSRQHRPTSPAFAASATISVPLASLSDTICPLLRARAPFPVHLASFSPIAVSTHPRSFVPVHRLSPAIARYKQPTRLNDVNPSICPSPTFIAFRRAYRLFPSITNATCRGNGPRERMYRRMDVAVR